MGAAIFLYSSKIMNKQQARLTATLKTTIIFRYDKRSEYSLHFPLFLHEVEALLVFVKYALNKR